MNRFMDKNVFRKALQAAAACVGILALSGCESGEVGTIKPPDVKDRAEVLPGYKPDVKSPYSAGATLKKNTPKQTEADRELPANKHPSL